MDCVELFRRGCDLIGLLANTGNGSAIEPKTGTAESIGKLKQNRLERNRALISNLKEDEHAKELWAMVVDDAAKGRMSKPVPVGFDHLSAKTLSPRFCIIQGIALLARRCSSITATVCCCRCSRKRRTQIESHR